MAVFYFSCVYLGKSIKLKIFVKHLEQAAKRIYGIPEFRFYALADGTQQVLFGRHSGIGVPRFGPEWPGDLFAPSEALENGETPELTPLDLQDRMFSIKQHLLPLSCLLCTRMVR